MRAPRARLNSSTVFCLYHDFLRLVVCCRNLNTQCTVYVRMYWGIGISVPVAHLDYQSNCLKTELVESELSVLLCRV